MSGSLSWRTKRCLVYRRYLVGVDFVEKCPLKGSWKQVIELAHGDTFAKLVEVEHAIAVGVVQLIKAFNEEQDSYGVGGKAVN